MKTATLDKSGLRRSRIALDELGGHWGAFEQDPAVRAIQGTGDRGVNFFDTAPAYGSGVSGSVFDKTLRGELNGAREDLIIASKGGLRQTGTGPVHEASPQWLRRGVHVAIVGARQAGHVAASLAAADVALSEGDLADIGKIMVSGTPIAGPSPASV